MEPSTYDKACAGQYNNKKPYARRKDNPKIYAAYEEEDARLYTQFLEDLEAEYKMTGHPKAQLLFDKAWARGHASGYAEVAGIYSDLVELVQ